MSVRRLAAAAQVSASTVHRIERGRMHPTVDLLERLAQAAGARLRVEAETDSAASVVGLGRGIAARAPRTSPVALAAELVGRFWAAGEDERLRMISGEPRPTGDRRWDAFLAALAEWLAVTAGLDPPAWVRAPDRFLGTGWWVTPMRAMRAWEYAGAPAAFKIRGVYIHRDSLTNV